jgi:hypothetical protein
VANNYQAVAIENFGGLDLRSDPQDQNPVRAIDLRDVELDQAGRVRMRGGLTKIFSSSGTTPFTRLEPFRAATGANPQVVTIDITNGRLYAYDATSGAAVTNFLPTTPTVPGELFGAVMIGVPTASQVMYLTVDGGDFLVKYDGSTFSNTAIGGGAHHIAVQYPDNRLVLANSGVATTKSRVVFSAANNPESFDLANDFIDLLPGDGEDIIGMANFRNDLFVFKQSAFWRFYGNSTDSVGGTVFNNTMTRHNLNTPYRYAGRIVTSGDEGVYFLAQDGIYVTTGGQPQKISQAIDPMFQTYGRSGYFVSYEGGAQILPELHYVAGRLYVNWWNTAPGATSSGQVFVYDPKLNTWTYWTTYAGRGSQIRGIASIATSSSSDAVPYFLSRTGATTGTTRSVIGYLDNAGEPGSMKRVREVLIEGYGQNIQVSISQNNRIGAQATMDFVTPAVYGTTTSPVWPNVEIGQGRMRKSIRGQNFTLAIAGSPGGVMLSRAVLHVDAPRPAGMRLLT